MVSEQDFERLSAYIDRELPPDEQTALEQRLQNEPDLRRELDELRIIVQAVRGLPTVQRPREFTLTPEMVGTGQPTPEPRFLLFPATPLVSALSSVAAALLLIAGGLLLFTATGPMGGAAYAPAPVAVQPTFEALDQAPIATDNLPTATMPATATRAATATTGAATLEDDTTADMGDDDMAADEAEVEVEEAEAESAEESGADESDAEILFGIVATDTTAPAEPPGAPGMEEEAAEAEAPAADGVGRSITGGAPSGAGGATGDAGAVPNESQELQMTARPSLQPTQQPAPTVTSLEPTATPAIVAESDPADIVETPPTTPERQLPAPSPELIAVLLLVAGGVLALFAVGTFIQRRRDRGRT